MSPTPDESLRWPLKPRTKAGFAPGKVSTFSSVIRNGTAGHSPTSSNRLTTMLIFTKTSLEYLIPGEEFQ